MAWRIKYRYKQYRDVVPTNTLDNDYKMGDARREKEVGQAQRVKSTSRASQHIHGGRCDEVYCVL